MDKFPTDILVIILNFSFRGKGIYERKRDIKWLLNIGRVNKKFKIVVKDKRIYEYLWVNDIDTKLKPNIQENYLKMVKLYSGREIDQITLDAVSLGYLEMFKNCYYHTKFLDSLMKECLFKAVERDRLNILQYLIPKFIENGYETISILGLSQPKEVGRDWGKPVIQNKNIITIIAENDYDDIWNYFKDKIENEELGLLLRSINDKDREKIVLFLWKFE